MNRALLLASVALFLTAKSSVLAQPPGVTLGSPAPLVTARFVVEQDPAPSAVRAQAAREPLSGAQDLDAALERTAPVAADRGVVFGSSFYLLRPYSQNDTAYRSTTGLVGLSPQFTTTDFHWTMQPAFAIWAGYTVGDGLGVRGRWYHFDSYSSTESASLGGPKAAESAISASPFLPAVPLPAGAGAFGSPGLLLNSGLGTDILAFSSTLRIDTADAEVTWTGNYGNCKFIVGAGGRYLHMDQGYQGRLANNLADGVTRESQSLNFAHNFNGGGPVLDLQSNWRIAGSNLSLYGLGRGALLVGQSHQFLTYDQNINDPKGLTNGGFFPVVANINPSSITYTQNVMPTLELELGLEYGQNWGRTHLFVRSAVVSQTYFGAGNASRTDANLSLFGLQWSAGVNY